ncbi:MAG: 3-dehydroquinate dehydratase [Clostridiales bacterium]|nr:3-dehydroquinate dehydratase [Clostridiales bacterium]
MNILLLNGVNLNMLGKRDSAHYGTDTLKQLEDKLTRYALAHGVSLECVQSNVEGELIDILQQTDCDAVVLNAGAYSHYSYALRDCIECIDPPVVEVHMSNIYEREAFRHNDVLADVCIARFYGNGINSYKEAIDFLIKHAHRNNV